MTPTSRANPPPRHRPPPRSPKQLSTTSRLPFPTMPRTETSASPMSVTAADFTKLDPYWTERLPYNFAKRHGVIAARLLDNGVEVWTRPEIASAILVEVQRALGQPIQPHSLSADEFDVALNRAYECGQSDRLRIVDD